MDGAQVLGFSSVETEGIVVVLANQKNVAELWPVARLLLEKNPGPWEDLYGLDHLGKCVEDESMQLWLARKGTEAYLTMITEIVEYPKMTVLNAVAIAGKNVTDVFPFFKDLQRWARLSGIEAVMAGGRSGWGKLLKPLGFAACGDWMLCSLRKES